MKKLFYATVLMAASACFSARADDATEAFFKNETAPFAKAFRTKTKRFSQRGRAGFDAKTEGLSAGFNAAGENGALGVSFSTVQTDVSEKDGGPKTRLDTRTAALSGLYKPENVFFTARTAFSWGKNKDKATSRKTDANTLTARLLSGYEFENSSPMYGVRYVHGGKKGVDAKKTDILTGIIAMRAAKTYGDAEKDAFLWRPEFSLAATYDFHVDPHAVAVFLPDGAAYNADSPRVRRFGAEMKAGVTAFAGKDFSVCAEYLGAARTAYRNHTFSLRAAYAF